MSVYLSLAIYSFFLSPALPLCTARYVQICFAWNPMVDECYCTVYSDIQYIMDLRSLGYTPILTPKCNANRPRVIFLSYIRNIKALNILPAFGRIFQP